MWFLASLKCKCRAEKLNAVNHCSLFSIFQPSLYCSSNNIQFFNNKYFSWLVLDTECKTLGINVVLLVLSGLWLGLQWQWAARPGQQWQSADTVQGGSSAQRLCAPGMPSVGGRVHSCC